MSIAQQEIWRSLLTTLSCGAGCAEFCYTAIDGKLFSIVLGKDAVMDDPGSVVHIQAQLDALDIKTVFSANDTFLYQNDLHPR
jgi:hypothetical protein